MTTASYAALSLEGLIQIAAAIKDPAALEKLRSEFAGHAQSIDDRLAAVTESENAARKLAEDAAKQKEALDAREAETASQALALSEGVRHLETDRTELRNAQRAHAATVEQNTRTHAAREQTLTEREHTLEETIAQRTQERQQEQSRQQTALDARETALARNEEDYQTRLADLIAREASAKEILDRAAALGRLGQT